MRFLITVLLLMALTSAIDAQAYALKPFNPEVEKLPAFFTGNDGHRIARAMLPLALEVAKRCGEFEKTADCQQRLNKIYYRTLAPGLTATDILAFSVPAECSYTADIESISCQGRNNWASRLIKESNYRATNTFGVSRVVKHSKFENIDIEDRYANSKFFRLKNVPPAEAKGMIRWLRVLLIGTPTSPFVKVAKTDYRPTLDRPEHTEGTNYSIVLDVDEVWLYNLQTGKVLMKRSRE
jgi:hypothetical protein